MRFIIISCLLTLSAVVFGQATTDHDLVYATVQDYIDGTSFNRPELLEISFYADISMYFSRGEAHWQPAREEYIGFFRGKEPGTPTGRLGNIRLVEVSGDVATAKAEILIPNRRLFIDYFLLKKIEGKWWIVSKTASSGPTEQHGGRVVIVASNATVYGDTDLPTANHFGEIAAAYDVFVKAGYTVDIVSPEGGPVNISYLSSADATTKPYLRDAEFWYRLNHTRKAADVRAEDYAAVYFPGGGAAMFGVADNPDVQRLTRMVYENEGAVAAICHGTAGITNIPLTDGSRLLTGKKLTGFPDGRERKDLPYYKTFPFAIDDRVAEQDGIFLAEPAVDTGFFVTDGRLVTGMDHSATAKVATAVVEMLRE